MKCPQCQGGMAKYKDDLGRRWLLCLKCRAQIPIELGYREAKVEDTVEVNDE